MAEYITDPEVERLANQLIEKYNLWARFPEPPKVVYLLRVGPWNEGERMKLGQCSKATGKWKYLTNVDFVIVLNKDFWTAFPESREALLLHELLHIDGQMVKYAGVERWKWYVRKHDIEEFATVVKEYGAWNERLLNFVRALREGMK